jgi:hypothetical protein
MHFIPLQQNNGSYFEDTIKYVCSVLNSSGKTVMQTKAKDNLMLGAT